MIRVFVLGRGISLYNPNKNTCPSFTLRNIPKALTEKIKSAIHKIQLLQHSCLFSHLQYSGSFRHNGQIIVPHPVHLLSCKLHAQCLHFIVNSYDIKLLAISTFGPRWRYERQSPTLD